MPASPIRSCSSGLNSVELDYYRWVASELEPAKEIKLFGLSDHFIRRYADLADAYVDENRRVASHRAVTGAALTALSTIAYYGAVGTIVYQTVAGPYSLGDLTFLMGTFERSRGLIGSILMSIARGYEAGLHLKDLFDFLEVKPSIVSVPDARPMPEQVREGSSSTTSDSAIPTPTVGPSAASIYRSGLVTA